jgi:hypothetical protein
VRERDSESWGKAREGEQETKAKEGGEIGGEGEAGRGRGGRGSRKSWWEVMEEVE